jgi:hypothetical protein
MGQQKDIDPRVPTVNIKIVPQVVDDPRSAVNEGVPYRLVMTEDRNERNRCIASKVRVKAPATIATDFALERMVRAVNYDPK